MSEPQTSQSHLAHRFRSTSVSSSKPIPQTPIFKPSPSLDRRSSLPSVNGSVLDLDMAAPPPTAERRLRVAKVLTKSRTRATHHVNQFFRINVSVSSVTFQITVDKDQSVEYLTKQIEAEYAFKYIHGRRERDEVAGREGEGEEDDGEESVPVAIGQVYDSGMLALRFGEKVGDVLAFDDTVFAINTYDAQNRRSLELTNTNQSLLAQESTSDITDPELETTEPSNTDTIPDTTINTNADTILTPTEREIPTYVHVPSYAASFLAESSYNPSSILPHVQTPTSASYLTPPTLSRLRHYSMIANPTLDDRLQSTLHNKMSMRYFSDFCIEEYTMENLLFWLDVEIFQNCDAMRLGDFARYIYLVYVAAGAPMEVNLSAEVRKDIPWPVVEGSSWSEVDIGMFDEAQEQAYAMMKGHSFVRYEKSPKYKHYVEAKRSDRAAYSASRINGPYASHFPVDLNAIMSITKIIEQPALPTSQRFLQAIGDNVVVDSPVFREALLKHLVSERFPNAASSPTFAMEGYFSDANRNSWAQKQKRMQKEKKLNKFFGTRPSTEQIQRQVATAKPSLTDFASLLGEVLGITKKADPDVEQETNVDAGDGTPNSNINRRRKMEKLETFFGDKLPSQQKRVQQLVSASFASVEPPPVPGDSPPPTSCELENPDEIQIATKNELDPEERRILQRRTRKIADMLGESLDERTVAETVTRNVDKFGTLETMILGTGWGPRTDPESTNRSLSNPNPDKPGVIPSKFKPKRSNSEQNLVMIDDEDPFFFPERSIGIPRSNTAGSISSLSTFASTEGDPDPSSKLADKKRLDKLSHMMGERISKGQLSQAQAAAMASVAASSKRPLTADEKKVLQKKATKLERLLGDRPPTETIVVVPAVQRMRRSIASISYVIRNTTDVVDLLETLTSLTDDNSVLTSTRSSTSTSSTTTAPILTKESRQKRLNKLTRFFGAQVSVETVLERQLLGDLERNLEEEVSDPTELNALKQELDALRSFVRERDSQLTREMDETAGASGGGDSKEEEGSENGTSYGPNATTIERGAAGILAEGLPSFVYGETIVKSLERETTIFSKDSKDAESKNA